MGADRDTPCTSLQSRVSLSYPPLLSVPCLPPPLLTVVYCIVLLHHVYCPGQVCGACLFETLFLPPYQAQTAFTVASHMGYSFAWKGCMEQCWQGWGSLCNWDLGSDLRHCSCRGKNRAQDVQWVHKDLTGFFAPSLAVKESLVYSHLTKRRETHHTYWAVSCSKSSLGLVNINQSQSSKSATEGGNHRIIERLKRTLKLIQLQLTAAGRDTFH